MRAAFVLAAALSAVVLSGCDKDAQADQTTAAPAAAPDPSAPAPGTQAAEAIGADSASPAPVAATEKLPH